jgi:nucleoside-diphosphate-sugar epimerase
MITTEEQLEDLLSTPRAGDRVDGDLLILGAGGKMGPTLAMRAKRAGTPRVLAVARYSSAAVRERLERAGVETIPADLLEPGALDKLPDTPNVIFMAAMKFGTTGAEHMTWAMNTFLPGLVAERFRHSRIVAFSTGNVYPLVPVTSGGATEDTLTEPIGEYAQSALGRERMFEYGSRRHGTPCVLLRLNYATELRYGVLVDVARKVWERRPVDVRMGVANVIWQGDANSWCLQSFAHCQSPPMVLNITGPEALSIRWAAREFGTRFSIEPIIEGEEAPTALLNNAARAMQFFGYPNVTPVQMIDWIAEWIAAGGTSLGKPTHFETRDGRF